ncbi:AtpZ/AtpI family protein [Limibaculum sp. M0105]|uniref:ATP synthase protein I n=2 Tax=Thermohalobaculum xanthum TaxID=2753746 RepID=A0A8J7M9U9_9RHOB|nr:AtpZ/AtpI family protein [Thermohalobaculum xanthum]
MGVPKDRGSALDDLGGRIDAARSAQRPKSGRAEGEIRAASIAWRMVTELVVGVFIGAAIGWGIDRLAGTLPLFLIVFGILGFAAGVKTMLRSAEEIRRKQEASSSKGAPSKHENPTP